MNPLLRIASSIDQGIGNLAQGVNNFFWKAQPTAQATKGMPNSPMSLQIKSPVPMTPLTNQLPPYIKSPIPQQQVVQHPIGPSIAEKTGQNIQNMLKVGQNTANQWENLFGFGKQTKIPVAQPTPPTVPLQHPAQPLVQNLVQRFGKPIQKPTIPNPTPTPTPRPGVLQVKQLPTQIPGVTPQVAQAFLGTLQKILPVTRSYGIPDAVAAAQAAQESGYMQKPAGQNNFYGLKAHSYPGFAHFDTPEQGATYYAQTVASKVPNMQGMTPLQVLQALQSGAQHYEGDNPNPMQYVYDVSHNPVWSLFGGGTPYPTNPHGWAQ